MPSRSSATSSRMPTRPACEPRRRDCRVLRSGGRRAPQRSAQVTGVASMTPKRFEQAVTTSSSRARSARSPPASTRRCAPSARSAARRGSSCAARARICGTPTASATSITSARGGRRSPATRIPAVVDAVQRAAARGLSFGAPTELEVELAEKLIARLPSLELVRLVSSGTEATMSALRLARGFTGRPQDRQVRRLLSRPRRQPAREGRFGRADVRPAVVGRRAVGDRQRDDRAAVQRPRRGPGNVRSRRRRHRRHHRRAGRGQHEPRSLPTRGFLRGVARRFAIATAPC